MDIDETSQQSGKQDFFRQILRSSPCIYEISGSQFFRTSTWIQSGPEAFDEQRLVSPTCELKKYYAVSD